jgi:hypothetical protein
MSRADSSDRSTALAQPLARHEVIDLARAAVILMLTVAAALFVPRSLFATTPQATPSAQVSPQISE